MSQALLWAAFATIIAFVLALDLGVFNRRVHAASVREAAVWCGIWVALACLFAVGVFLYRGSQSGLQFVTGYVIELSLSADNVFLFAVIFTHFRVPMRYQHRVLFWGILGAIVMRGVMIAVGAALVSRMHWILYVFGAFLVVTGIRMLFQRSHDMDVAQMPAMRLLTRVLRVTKEYDGHRFFVRVNGTLYATPLFVVLGLVEFTDLVFALDSIPAIFGVTKDPFIIFTSNVFAILGLRSFYFLLAGAIELFEYLNVGLSLVLIFVGAKMLELVHVSTAHSLLVVVSLLGGAIAVSLSKAARDRRRARSQSAA